ncbi:hypothetical protein [Hyphomonas johnsonii]|uniref:Uncharacterized protein n=1 Tax=Hyphomonas johnsonii MHS-2 TaxID=1280950 RepID=A0A059FS82_9PROT|nr:hypothetical protein [Hyphomonas johnsonii]KCZ93514.1 hypothetical protein HJO_06655 [Hyphomonas johnsonii MHS-2]
MNNPNPVPIKGRYQTPNELKAAHAALQLWMTPDEMEARFDVLSAVSGEYFFIQGGLQFIRDSHIAATFGKARRANRVRLCGGERPDFEIEVGNVTQLYEATEADLPGRRRGDEYKASLGKPNTLIHVENAEINANIAAVPGALRARALGKAGGGYDPSWGLVIFLNVATYGFDAGEIEACFEVATKPASSSFSEVWVLWGSEVYRPWPRQGE